ncbi:PAS domain S-box protein [Bacteroidota bacterium]
MEQGLPDRQSSEGLLINRISKFALQLEKTSDEKEIFQHIADEVKEQFPGTYIIITIITPQSNSYKIQVLKGIEKHRKTIEKLIGKDILSIEFPLKDVPEDNLRLNSNGKINYVEGGIFSLALDTIPKPIAKGVEKIMGIDAVYSIGMALDKLNFGNITIFSKKGNTLSDPDLQYIETLSVIASIALQKIRAHQKIRHDGEKINRIFQLAPAGIGVLSDERIFLVVNDQVCEITGYSREELIGKSTRMLYTDDDEFNLVGETKYHQLSEKGMGEAATQWVCKDGSLKHILLRSSAINPDDLSEGVLLTALDITQRIEAEQALQESEIRYRTLVENSPVAIMIHRQGIVEYINQAALTLIEADSADQVVGTPALELLHTDDRESAMSRITKMYQSGEPAAIAEERFLTFKGKEVNLQVAANLIQYQGSKASLVFGTDITEMKRFESEIIRFSKELEEINNAKDKFFSIIAHDLRGPFNSILGFADILDTEYDEYSDDERKHFISNIASSAQNTYSLLENLLEWSRAQTNRIDFNPFELELSSIINESILLVHSQAESKNIHLYSAVEYGTLVMADENMVKTIVRNLLSNAIKFSRRRGNIRVMERQTTHPQSGLPMVEITVKDDGIGMSPAILEKLFKIDQMIRTPGTDNEKGTGLGLILCKELVNRHGGEIWAESTPGQGSTLYFTLPRN